MANPFSKLDEIFELWQGSTIPAIGEVVAANPERTFYAAGFWLFYCDYTVIYPPSLGMNSEQHLQSQGGDGRSERWSPSEWEFDILPVTELLRLAYADLSKPLEGRADSAWNEILEQHGKRLTELCDRLTPRIKKEIPSLPGNFVIGIFEGR